jgi:aminoglycoside phosphotransferase (APT) family kinase protein
MHPAAARSDLSERDRRDAAAVAASCLRRHGPVASAERVPSRRNVVVRLQLADGVRRIVKLAATDATGSGMAREPAVAAALLHAGVPAPRVRHCDPRGRLLRRVFLVEDDAGRRTAADTAGLSAFNRRNLFRQVGRVLAHVHAADVASELQHVLPGGDGRDPVDSWRRRHARRAVTLGLFDEWPGLADEVTRLGEAATTAVSSRRSLCHGDYNPSQCVRRGPAVTAAVDWESAYLGDASHDRIAFEAMLRCTVPHDLADAAVAAYHEVLPLDLEGPRDTAALHAAALATSFTDARRPAFARAARLLVARHFGRDVSRGSRAA